MRAALALVLIFLAGCSTVSVRAPTCDPPPIPPELLRSCPPAIMPAGNTPEEVIENVIANVTGPWRECVRLHDQTVAVVKYRDTICPKIQADNVKPRPWYQWWD